jgi:two-component system, OmpR family, response regulator MtrA
MTTVLVVDDEPIVREVVVSYLKREGYETLEAADGERARELLEQQSPSLVVLDVMLPRVDGLELCRWIRSRSELPVILLTARGDEADRIVGLELGADDYVTKPFDMPVLVARCRAVLRRAAAEPADPILRVGDLEIDVAGFVARKDGRDLPLTATEFRLLVELVRRPGQVLTREVLLARVWDYEFLGDSRLVDVAVQRLRAKIEDDPSRPSRISTVRGVGYRLERG